MKKLYTLLLIFILGSSCVKVDNIDRDDGGFIDYSVSDAKEYYYKFLKECPLFAEQKTRGDRENSLLDIEISPEWHNTITARNKGRISINTAITEDREVVAVIPDLSGNSNYVYLAQKLIVIKDTEKNKEATYLMTFIPDASFCPYPEKMNINSFIHSGKAGEYSGWVMYSTPMTSYVVRLDYYKDGVKLQEFHIFGKKKNERQAAIKQIYTILSQMTFGTILKSTTRAVDPPSWRIQMETLYVYFPAPDSWEPDDPDGEIEYLPEDPEKDDRDHEEDYETDDDDGIICWPIDPGEPDKKNPPTPDPPVKDVDCTEANETLADLANDMARFFDSSGMGDFIRDYQFHEYEHSQSLDDMGDGLYDYGSIQTSNQPDRCPVVYGPNTVATIHNHPVSHIAHSMMDVVGLARISNDHSKINTSYVITLNGDMFALAIEDRGKVSAFYNTHMNNQDALQSELGAIYSELLKHSPYDVAHVHAVAYMLQKYNVGMKILRQENMGFRARETDLMINSNGAVENVSLTKCK